MNPKKFKYIDKAKKYGKIIGTEVVLRDMEDIIIFQDIGLTLQKNFKKLQAKKKRKFIRYWMWQGVS